MVFTSRNFEEESDLVIGNFATTYSGLQNVLESAERGERTFPVEDVQTYLLKAKEFESIGPMRNLAERVRKVYNL